MFKPKFMVALKDGTIEVVEKTLAEAWHLKFEIKEHTMLKQLRFKLIEKQELER